MTPEELTAGHGPQLAALSALLYDPRRFHVWFCSRRAGKSEAAVFALLTVALSGPNKNCIYAALTRGQSKETIWRTKWLPLLERLGIEAKHNHTNQQTIFENGSSVVFGGLDDKKHIQTFLGNDLDLFICDESQSAPSSLLKELFEVVLAPALSDRAQGRFLFSGTIPEIASGYFYDAATNGRWVVHNWNRFENPFLSDQQKALDETLKVSGLTADDPIIRRNWFGELVFDPRATAYRYDRRRNGYEGPPPPCEYYAVGIDPGTRDRCAVEVWGWRTDEPFVWHVDEWVTERNAGTTLGQVGAECGRFRRLYNPFRYYIDMGGSQMAVDVFNLDHGIPVMAAANKQDLGGQVMRFADLLQRGLAKVRIGSALETDLEQSRFDQDARQEGRWKWSTNGPHPDAADAARYGLAAYFDMTTPMAKSKSPQELEDEAWRASLMKPVPAESHWDGEGSRQGAYGGTVED